MSVRNAVRRALAHTPIRIAAVAIGCPMLLMSSPAAYSQSASDDPTADLKEVVVVGSRIRRDTFNSPSPIQITTREETTLAGFQSMTDALQGTAITTGAAQVNNAFGGFVTNGGPGANTLSLRNLGEGRTLVLINGRRIAPAGTRGAVGSADLNVLPNSIIDRVEVLRDGASSIYGSDAIGGVVNIVTMENVRGLTLEASLNQPTREGARQSRASAVYGVAGERWEFAGSMDFYDRDESTLRDRDWTRCNVDGMRDPNTRVSRDYIDPRTGQPKCYPITGTGSNGVTINTIGTQEIRSDNFASLGLNGPVVGAAGSAGTAFNRFRPNPAVNRGVLGFEGVGGGTNNLNVRDTFEDRMLNRTLISPARIYTAFGQGTFDLQAMGEGEIYFELLANRRESQQTGYRQLSMDYRQGSPLIPANLAFGVFGPDQGTSGGQNVGVRAFVGFGNDHNEQTVNFYKPMVGLRGNLSFLSEWKYDAGLSYSKSDASYSQESFLTDKLTFSSDAVAAPAGTDSSLVRNGLTCRVNLTNPGERCIPFPALNADTIGGNLPQDFKDYIFRPVEGNTEFEESLVTAYFDGPVFELPAGKIQGVLGFEHRRQEIDDTPDPNSISGNLYNLTSATPTRGKDHVSEAFTEVDIPIFREVTGAYRFNLTGSFRYTDYDSYGDDTTYKYGFVYGPTEWFTVRGSRGTSYRAPALYEQFQGPTSGFFSQANDPCNNYGAQGVNPTRAANCAAELPGRPTFVQTSGIRSLSVGGAENGLFAETSDNRTIGFVFQPPVEGLGLQFAMDYFHIQIDNGVDQPGTLNILPLCYDDPDFRTGGGFCRLVARDATTNTLTVSNAYTNIATQIATGFDYTLRWEKQAGPGRVRFNTALTRYTSQANKLFEEDELDELNGTIGVPKWSGTADISYRLREWQVQWGVDWLGSMNSYAYRGQNQATSNFDYDVPDYLEHRVAVRYVKGPLEVTGGVRNVFDAEPEQISQGFYNRVGNGPLYSGYDYIGRRAFLSAAWQF
jgi:iron complex outermembrane recepter protein